MVEHHATPADYWLVVFLCQHIDSLEITVLGGRDGKMMWVPMLLGTSHNLRSVGRDLKNTRHLHWLVGSASFLGG